MKWLWITLGVVSALTILLYIMIILYLIMLLDILILFTGTVLQ